MDTRRATRSQQRGNEPQTPRGRQPAPEEGVARARQQASPYPEADRARAQRTPSVPAEFRFMPYNINQRREDPESDDEQKEPGEENENEHQPDLESMDTQGPTQQQRPRQEQQLPPFIPDGRREVPYYAQVLDPTTGRLHFPRVEPPPMRPMDVAQEYSLDYTTPQTIKFFTKGIEKLTGDAFDGTMLFTWLIKIQDKALLYSWIPNLTIEGKILTTSFADISLAQVREHAQIIQNEGRRRAQNSEMMLCCLKSSITTAVYTKVFLQRSNYIIIKQPGNIPVEDGICFLKVIIDSYHSNTRSTTTEVRRQLAHLDAYMRDVAKGDVTKLCNHTRSLLYELNAAGETTHDLITNLISGLRRAPDSNFQRWFSNQIDLWSMRQRDWRPDGSDLMDEAELYFKEAKQTNRWGKKATNGNGDPMYAFRASGEEFDDIPDPTYHTARKTKELQAIEALSTRIDNLGNQKWDATKTSQYSDEKYKWKLKAPKDGESTSKKMLIDGKTKKYHWCEYHKLWTIHSPKECKMQTTGKIRVRKASTKGKRSKYGIRKKSYMEARAALDAEYGLDGYDSNVSISSGDESNLSNTGRDDYSDEEGDSDSS